MNNLHKIKAYFISFLFVTIPVLNASSQSLFSSAYSFTNLPPGALLAATGSINCSRFSDDPNAVLSNPALSNSLNNYHLAINFSSYLAGVEYGGSSFIFNYPGKDSLFFQTGFQFVDYGTMDRTLADGTIAGTFSAGDNLFFLGFNRQKKNFYYGTIIKYIDSRIYTYYSRALLADVGCVYKAPNEEFSFGIVVKNIGFQIKTYNGIKEQLPFDIQTGITHKLDHLPLRYTITAYHLQQLDIMYIDENRTTSIDDKGNPVKPEKSLLEQVYLHFSFGGEFIIGKYLSLNAGFNPLRRKDFLVSPRTGLAGFSAGIGLHFKYFNLEYAKAIYHTSVDPDFLTFTTNLNSFINKKQIPSIIND